MPIAANLRLPHISDAFANDLPDPADPPWTPQLRVLWRCAQRLAQKRGKADVNRIDYGFEVDWDAAPEGVVRIAGVDARQVADAILKYYVLGVDSFLIRGFDPFNDTVEFGRELIPRIKAGAAAIDLGRLDRRRLDEVAARDRLAERWRRSGAARSFSV